MNYKEWHKNSNIPNIYKMVLEEGWSIRIDAYKDGKYSLIATRENLNWNNFTEDWQFSELDFVQHMYFAVPEKISNI